jgi:hypothetical protein
MHQDGSFASETFSYTKLKVPTQHIVSSNPTGVQRSGTFYIYSLMRQFHFAVAPSGAHREETCEDIKEAELIKSWDLQLFVTDGRVKGFFGYSKDKQDEFIKFAEAPSGAHTEETSEGIQEAELDDSTNFGRKLQ